MGGNSSKSKGTNVYAELISRKSPPIKVLLNEQITSKAVDSLKDSKDIVNFFANNLVIEVLEDKNTPKKFGDFLKYTFSFESTLAPTRSLVYWSIMSDVSFQNLRSITVSQMSYWICINAKQQILDAMNENMISKNFKNVNIHPLILWTLHQDNTVISPLSNIIIHSLPYVKSDVIDGIKYAITESLKSEEVKTNVRNTILYHLKKVGNRNSATK